ncbi:restriction endonuclease subunit S [Sphingobium sufflavum]|uniref:restriction endonuclease subunit S n=1 Tax=Sphingobium sufflavum TaxID=1129547 RepID=UPI001F190967|nr:restriction endonuclease subunit S [Sphingobium sufflavum]MCE7796525.1 restriction endonuclease subunit S [Sphingobium sufflavum]
MSLVVKLAHSLSTQTGVRSIESMPIALAAMIAAAKGIEVSNPADMLSALAQTLQPTNEADALTRVRDWLEDINLSTAQLRGVQSLLPVNVPAAIDWTVELEALVDDARYRESFIPISPRVGTAIGVSLNIPADETVACLFAGSATIAWGLATIRPVTLHVTNWQTEIIMAMLAYADGRPLQVDRRNPIETIPFDDGAFTFDESHSPRRGAYDHLIAVPPLSYRMKDGPAAGMLFEAWQVEQLAYRARKSFVAVVADGLLFRESRNEVAFREQLCTRGGLTVASLPPGIFGRASGVQVNLLKIDQTDRHDATFIDGRSMERISRSGREQEDLIVKHLESLPSAPSRTIGTQELAGANYTLLPNRYVVSDELVRMDEALSARHTVRLGDIAKILRPRAPQPVRGDPSEDDVIGLEIAVSDIVDGKVVVPSKEARFPASERLSVGKVRVEMDDILVSVKGNVGAVGIVGMGAILDELMDTPQIVVSQSLAIIRLERGSAIREPRVLAGILSSPQMRAKLQALAGGTTVPSLPIGALQDLTLPVPDAEEASEIEGQLTEFDTMREDIDARIGNLRIMQDALWRKFWNTSPEQQDA